MTCLLRFGYSPPASGTITPLGVAASASHACFGWGWGGQIAGALPRRAEISWDPASQSPGEGEAICKKIRLVKAD